MTEALDPQRVTQARRQYEERASSLFDQQRLPSESRDYLTGVSIHQSTRQIWENHEKEVYSLLDDHGVPRDVWSDITLIPSSSTVKGVITAFQRFRFEPFTIQDYQKLVGGSQRQADDDAMSAVLIGIVQQSERQGMLAFRKTKGPSGWDAFYQWDDDTLFYRLQDAFDYFESGSFTLEDYRQLQRTSNSGIPYEKSNLELELRKGIMARVLTKRGALYIFSSPND